MATDLLTSDPQVSARMPAGRSIERSRDAVAPRSDEPATGSDELATGAQGLVRADATTMSMLVRDYVELTKPRIVTMILVTTVATAIIGAGGWVGLVDLAWLLFGTGMIAGSAGAANQIWERVIDCRMTRTANRPLPGGRLSLSQATVFMSILGVAGATVLASFFGSIPAAAGVGTWVLYVLVYTPMKTRTSWNTTVGAVAGALPVLIGYTATGGSLSDPSGWLLFGVLAFWQYPHFMAIAWMYRRQYDEAGFKMTTTVEPTGRSAGRQSIAGSLALIGCGVGLCFLGTISAFAWVAAVGVLVSTVPMLRASIAFSSGPDDVLARKLLRSSLLVLPAVLLMITLRVFW